MALTQEQINRLRGNLHSKQQQAPSSQGGLRNFFADAVQDVKEIGSGVKERAFERADQFGEQQTLVGKFGQGVGFAGDIIGETVLGAAKAAVPQSTEEAVSSGFESTAAKVLQNEKVQEGLAAIERFKKENPTLSEALTAVGNTAILGLDIVGIGGGAQVAKTVGKKGLRTTKDTISKGVDTVGSKTRDVGSAVTGALKDIKPTRQAIINEQVTKALDFAPGDLNKIARATDNEAGIFLADQNLIGTNKANTVRNLEEFADDAFNQVREEIGLVGDKFTHSDIPQYKEALNAIKDKTKGKAGLQEVNKELGKLIRKKNIKLTDVQRTKELLDEHFSLFSVTGDIKESVEKQGLANVRQSLRGFIEDKVEIAGGGDIKLLNNNVATSKTILETIKTRSPKGLTKSNIKLGDLGIFGVASTFGGPATGLAALLLKKIIESPSVRLRFAKWLDKIDDAKRAEALEELRKGTVSDELQKAVGITDATE